MPYISSSTYHKVPFYLRNGHMETIIPSLFRKVKGVNYERERIDTSDGDFLDLDWSRISTGQKRLLIVSHGLEGSTDRHYVKGLTKLMNGSGWDVMGWNCRSCGGEMNRAFRLYHHGATDDLAAVIDHVLALGQYEEIYLAGISMGGSMTLKYLGEQAHQLSDRIRGAGVYSVPCSLPSSAATLSVKGNSFYKNRFLKKLKEKMKLKAAQYPDRLDISGIDDISSFDIFDSLYTAKLHGFRDAADFYQKASAESHLPQINVPVLIINAWNDPLLGDACYPVTLAKAHDFIHLETPLRGGHTGFMLQGDEFTWAEYRIRDFLTKL
ncbi:YheT family hydrolase [Penaeicola halotolerans]|uniref:YheT family hydrolase n=1 Tax=Penaeicola halotolerans TaxID=2793196 RepID=UPI001CF83EA9|nr:alpha/beta fold hydrolase [Penaeicola halotolerans]